LVHKFYFVLYLTEITSSLRWTKQMYGA